MPNFARPWTLALTLSVMALPAWSQMFKEPALESLYAAGKADELQRIGTQRLAAQPDDAQAVLALAMAALERDDAAQRGAALLKAQSCAERQPRSAACQYGYGVLLGIQAANDGLIKAARSIGTVKEALSAAHEADPAWYPARSALIEFHLIAPGLFGGSRSRADELVRSAPKAEQAVALQARLALADDQLERGLAQLLALARPADPALADDVASWGFQAGLQLVNKGQAAKAQPWFERMVRDWPALASGSYGLARVRSEKGEWTEALRLLELAQGQKGAANFPVLYRVGIAQQQLGRADAAKTAFKTFIAAGKGQKASLEDARKRLDQLGG
jgi:tetratricopeptide (TPR) repeat protein